MWSQVQPDIARNWIVLSPEGSRQIHALSYRSKPKARGFFNQKNEKCSLRVLSSPWRPCEPRQSCLHPGKNCFIWFWVTCKNQNARMKRDFQVRYSRCFADSLVCTSSGWRNTVTEKRGTDLYTKQFVPQIGLYVAKHLNKKRSFSPAGGVCV